MDCLPRLQDLLLEQGIPAKGWGFKTRYGFMMKHLTAEVPPASIEVVRGIATVMGMEWCERYNTYHSEPPGVVWLPDELFGFGDDPEGMNGETAC